MSLNDPELIARVLAEDDRHAFAELVRRHQSALRGFLRRLCQGDHALADDLAQETLIEAYRNLARFSGAAAFQTWLLGIGYNRFRQQMRKRREQPVADIPEDDAEALSRHEGEELKADLGHDLGKALSSLRPEEQAALQLCYNEGLSHDDAARVMGCPLGTLKTHILRAKARIKSLLGDYSTQS